MQLRRLTALEADSAGTTLQAQIADLQDILAARAHPDY